MESSELEADGVIAGASQTHTVPRKEEGTSQGQPRRTDLAAKTASADGGMLVALTAFFFIASFVQLYYLQTRIEGAPQLDLSPALTSLDNFEKDLKNGGVQNEAAFVNRLAYAKWKTLSLLEANALQRRYHQAGVLLIRESGLGILDSSPARYWRSSRSFYSGKAARDKLEPRRRKRALEGVDNVGLARFDSRRAGDRSDARHAWHEPGAASQRWPGLLAAARRRSNRSAAVADSRRQPKPNTKRH